MQNICHSFFGSMLAGAVVLTLAGCVTEPDSHRVSAPPPPTPTTTAPAVNATPVPPAQGNAGVTTAVAPNGTHMVIVSQPAPPTPPPEAVPERPSSSHVWIPGHWTWRNNRYEWMAGHWEVPPMSNATWVAPRWEPENGAYRFYEGHWAY